MEFTLIDETRSHAIDATVRDGRILLAPETIRDALGWSLEERGLCRGDECVPVRDRVALVGSEGIDLEALARTLDRPLALDLDEGVAALAASSAERSARLQTLEAPDFTLPDLDGKMHSLRDHRGKKVLLVAYASW